MTTQTRPPRVPALAADMLPWPRLARSLQLAVTLFVAVYMLFVGGTFDAGLRYPVQLLNTVLAGSLGLTWAAVRLTRRPRLAPTGLEWPLALFAAGQWLVLLTSAQPRLGLEWAGSVTAWSAALLILHDLLRRGWSREFVHNALMLLAAIITAEGLLEVAAWYAGWARLGLWPPLAFRLNGMLGHANLTAAFLNLVWPLVLVRTAAARHSAARAAWVALAVGIGVVVFFTSSRAGWLAAAAGFAALAALVLLDRGARTVVGAWQRWRGFPVLHRWLASLLAGATMAAVALLFMSQSQHITHAPLLSSRQTFWRVAWRMVQTQPLTGAGPDLYTWYYTRWVASPPDWFAPHAHSLIMQVVGGSGLIGLGSLVVFAAAAGWQLWRRWRSGADRLLLAGLSAGLLAVAVQHLFDYLLGSGVMVFAVVVVVGLALSVSELQTSARRYSPLMVLPAVIVPLLVALFALRGAALNADGLREAAAGDWTAAARAFERAASADPGLTLYWEQAAHAYTRAGQVSVALPLWQRAAAGDRYWPLLPATIGVLSEDRSALQAAQAQNQGRSALLALNEGALAEAAGDLQPARAAHTQALGLDPASAAALFWQQSDLRRQVVTAWRGTRDSPTTELALGELALANGQAEAARLRFQAALEQDQASLAATVGLASAELALGDQAGAERHLHIAQRLPIVTPDETLGMRLLAGDSARARGDLTAAAAAYGDAFSMVNDYTVFGPGTYGYPRRAWYVYRRAALPSDLVPQFARADITAPMDERFAWLAEWTAAQGNRDVACLIAERVWREAPESLSGAWYESACR